MWCPSGCERLAGCLVVLLSQEGLRSGHAWQKEAVGKGDAESGVYGRLQWFGVRPQ